MTAADGVPGDHGHHRLREAADLDLEIEDVETADALPGHGIVPDVAVVPPDLLVPARAEGVRPLPGEDDHADRRVVPGRVEGIGQLEQGLGPEGVADLGPGDGELGHAVGHVVVDVPVVAPPFPGRQGLAPEGVDRIDRWTGDDRLGRGPAAAAALSTVRTCSGATIRPITPRVGTRTVA